MIFPLINLLLILLIVVGATWFIKRKIGENGFNQISSKGYIKVIDEGIQIGMGQRVSLLKIGDELIVHSSGPNGIEMQKLEQRELVENNLEFDQLFVEEGQKNTLKERIDQIKEKMIKK